jgi:hypothetical protein
MKHLLSLSAAPSEGAATKSGRKSSLPNDIDLTDSSGKKQNGLADNYRIIRIWEQITGKSLERPLLVRNILLSDLAKQCTQEQLTAIQAALPEKAAQGRAKVFFSKTKGETDKGANKTAPKAVTNIFADINFESIF